MNIQDRESYEKSMVIAQHIMDFLKKEQNRRAKDACAVVLPPLAKPYQDMTTLEKKRVLELYKDVLDDLMEELIVFNWDDAKPGMAFMNDTTGEIGYYIEFDPSPGQFWSVIVAREYTEEKGFDNLCFECKEELTRVPEKDVKI